MKGFFYLLHTSILQGKKSSSTMQWAWIPKCLPSFYFIFFERGSSSSFYKGFLFFLIFIVHKIFIILAKLKQGQDKTARNKEAFSQNTHFEFLKAKRYLLWMLQVLLFEAQKGPCIISSTNLRTLPNKFEKFLAGVCPKRYASQSLR